MIRPTPTTRRKSTERGKLTRRPNRCSEGWLTAGVVGSSPAGVTLSVSSRIMFSTDQGFPPHMPIQSANCQFTDWHRVFSDKRFAKRDSLCYRRRSCLSPMFPGSSVVEQPAVNRLVAGSNPARGAIFHWTALQAQVSFFRAALCDRHFYRNK